MSFMYRNVIHLLWFILLWRFHRVKCHVDVCDMPHQAVYCTCDMAIGETAVTCFIYAPISKTDEKWSSVARVENAVALTLHSRLPTRLNYIPDTLSEMTDLRSLSVLEGDLGELQPYSVTNMASLRGLMLERNDITSLGRNAISDLPLLKKLALSENLLNEFLAESLVGLSELEQLFLDRNNISRIESCAFCDLQNLKELELWGNQITDLTEYTFRGLRYLKRLDLYKNQIRILNDKVFQSMPRLTEIDLKDNLIDYIAPRAFRGLDNLLRLTLNQNRLKKLPDKVFMSLSNLRSVDLYANELETLQEEVLHHMVNADEEHFTFMFKENPLKCGCSLHWVHKYLQRNKSHQFTRELQELKCRTADEELQFAKLLKLKCDKSKTTTTTTSTSATSRVTVITTDPIPTKLRMYNATSKSKIIDEDHDDVYFMDDDDNSACSSSIANFNLMFLAALSVLLSSCYLKT